jgi:hypothetical protein
VNSTHSLANLFGYSSEAVGSGFCVLLPNCLIKIGEVIRNALIPPSFGLEQTNISNEGSWTLSSVLPINFSRHQPPPRFSYRSTSPKLFPIIIHLLVIFPVSSVCSNVLPSCFWSIQ